METIDELAARWAVRADSGSLNAEDQRQLDSWLAADARHLGAYVRARAQWIDLDRLAALRGHDSPSAETVALWSRRGLLGAAAAALAVTGVGLSWLRLHDEQAWYSSGIGEMRRIALADGSTLLLNTDSEVGVRLTQKRRDLQLVRGEALFEVAHDASRPFIVRAQDALVRAVGTAFAVRLQNARVDVTVTEGVVEIVKGSSANSGGLRVAAHERATLAAARPAEVEPIAPAEADRQLAWRQGLVSFDGETLQVAVSEINRHNRRQIVVDDAPLASLPIVGVFRATDSEGFAAAAAAALDAHVSPEGEVIHLQSRSTSN